MHNNNLHAQDDSARDRILHDLRNLSGALHTLLPDAALASLPHFEDRGRPVDRPLLFHMVRNELKFGLEHIGFPVDDEQQGQEPEFGMHSLPLSGLEGMFSGYSFKIRKADFEDGSVCLPAAGTSQNALGFFNQQSFFSLVNGSLVVQQQGNDSVATPNVVYLWDLGPKFNNPTIWLAVPEQGGKTRRGTKARFITAVPHPVNAMVPVAPNLAASEPMVTAKLTTPSPSATKRQ